MTVNKNKGVTMNQRQATVNTILSVLNDRGVEYELNGPISMAETLNADDKTKIRSIMFTLFRAGKVDYRADFQAKVDDDKALKEYVSGLVNNWIRKAPEFNSDTTYKAKNPGSRQGSQDEQIKAMKGLLAITTDPEAKEAIEQAISDRQEALKPSVTINIDALPESLRHLVK
jgi:hypothetical protein